MSDSSGRRTLFAVIVSTAVSLVIIGGLSSCQGATDTPAGRSESSATTDAADARRAKHKQEFARLRIERDRLKAELSAIAEPKGKPAAQPTASDPTNKSAKTATRPDLAANRSPDSGLAASPASFDRLAARLAGSEGVAYTVLGGGATTRLGSWRSGLGWSTVKVPVAVAAVTQAGGHPDSQLQSLIRRSITVSDNAAAEQLWSYLGTPTVAAARTQAVLRSAGDAGTRIQSQRIRPGFTAFGQTTWSLARQAAFSAKLPCIKDTREVLRLMGDVEPGQRWGMGAAGRPARFKGGWGPGRGGGYLVRQMGIVTLANGSRIVLAIASEPADGRFETGTANLTASPCNAPLTPALALVSGGTTNDRRAKEVDADKPSDAEKPAAEEQEPPRSDPHAHSRFAVASGLVGDTVV